MRTVTPPTIGTSPGADRDRDAGYQALLDQAAAAVDQLRRHVTVARRAEPARRTAALAHLTTVLLTAAEQLHEHLIDRASHQPDGSWPPLPPMDEAP